MKKIIQLFVICLLLTIGTLAIAYETHLLDRPSSGGQWTLNEVKTKIANWLNVSNPQSSASESTLRSHPWLTLRAIQVAESSYGIDLSKFKTDIVYGSVEEDFDAFGCSTLNYYNHLMLYDDAKGGFVGASNYYSNSNRAANHFMNYDDDVAGLTDVVAMPFNHTSALKWAKDYESNLCSYNKALAATNVSDKWRYLGHVLHLLEDMTSPAHVRNDAHPIDTDNYEQYLVALKPSELDKLISSSLHAVQVSNTDIDDYFKDLSAYTRRNFFSDDTIHKEPSNSLPQGKKLPQATITREDSSYYYGREDETGSEIKLAYKGLLWWTAYTYDPQTSSETMLNDYSTIDENVAKDTFKYAGPKAIQYAAGLIKLFYDNAFGYEVRGEVLDRDGKPLSGVEITMTGTGTVSTMTGSDGKFKFVNAKNGTYVVKASYLGLLFNPSSSTITVANKDVVDVWFDVAVSNISGTIILNNGTPVSNVQLTMTGAGTGTATGTIRQTAADGSYSFNGFPPGSYTITPMKTGYTFTPGSLVINLGNNDNRTAQNFIAATTASAVTGAISGVVKDAVTDTPLSQVAFNVSLNGVSVYPNAVTDSKGYYSVTLPEGDGYLIDFSKPGYLNVSYSNIQVTKNITTNLEAVMQIDTAHTGLGTASGKVVNALNNVGVGGITINLRKGVNVKSGTIITSTTTNSDGTYTISNLNADNYTAEASGTGYITAYFKVYSLGNTTVANQNATITPVLPPDQYRILMSWGSSPSDLDAHLTGPLPTGARFHLYWPYAQTCPGHTSDCNSSLWNYSSYAVLDVDSINPNSSETTTLPQLLTGTYRFSVHDFVNRNSTSSYALSNSNAKVKVIKGSTTIAIYDVPPNQGGTLWTVFELNSGAITPVNTMTYTSDPKAVTKVISGMEWKRTDKDLIRNSIDKHMISK